jgi:glycosyltransferase involved in cell wall biosynthesis
VIRILKRQVSRVVRAALRRYARARPRKGDAGSIDRVTILLGSAWGMGGTIRASLNLAGHLAQTREVEILSLVRSRKTRFFEFPPGVEVTALDDQRSGATPRGLRLLRRVLRSRSSVLIHRTDRLFPASSLWTDVRLVRELRRRSGFLIGTRPGWNLAAADLSPPGLITIGQEHMHLGKHRESLRHSIAESYPHLDALVTLTDRDLGDYAELLQGVHLASIPNSSREMGGQKARLDEKTVLAAGRLRRQKGFDRLIRAFGPVAAAHPDWRLRICGRGRLREDLQRLIEEEGLSDVVTLAKRSKHLEREMERASLFVLSSRFEGFPLILLEAMSKGLPVVSFDCPTGPGEVIENRRSGILVPDGDVAALAAAMREVIEDSALRRRLAAAAVERAHDYSMEAIGPQWDALLDVLQRDRPS